MDLIRETARSLVGHLRAEEVTPADLIDALEARIAAVEPALNALPTLCLDRAREAAAEMMTRPVEARGVLAGLPVPIKDLSAVAGVRTTWGSPIYADCVPETSDHIVERIEERGGIVYAKSNTPEFGAGASTFNPVFGPTANPWNTARSPAGSSGGAAAALASGMAWLAHGSDMGGSLRNPASFCGIAGMRPSPGRVPGGPSADPFGTLSAQGPMARNIGDLGLFLDAMAGPHPREPVSQDGNTGFREAAESPRVPGRVAFSPDLGITPVDPEVAAICAAAARRFESLGATVEEAHPDLSGTMECFHVLRGASFATAHARHIAEHRDLLKPDVVWNVEYGQTVTGADIARANAIRTRIVAEMGRFFETYDVLLCPTTIVPPFGVNDRTVTACNGVQFETYIDWLAIVSAFTLAGVPALSLPCGVTADGLPVGLQVVGPFRGEARILSAAAALEAELGLDTGPIDPRGPAA